ncbi:hypothetical protein ElyMa_004564300 [Elysia marginata]|uniref:Uncharacterized protein n=1 Tax=Elysia marginata TaxID=1093978 RepID=A0AAV4HRG7_9GAST|nr:hypothetical protein ElyMa_004564300 [Elysia marginata]
MVKQKKIQWKVEDEEEVAKKEQQQQQQEQEQEGEEEEDEMKKKRKKKNSYPILFIVTFSPLFEQIQRVINIRRRMTDRVTQTPVAMGLAGLKLGLA